MYSLGKQTDIFSKFIGHLYLNIGIYKSLTIIDYSLYLFVSSSFHHLLCYCLRKMFLMLFWFR